MLGGSLVRLHNDFPEGPKLIFFLLLVVWLGDAPSADVDLEGLAGR